MSSNVIENRIAEGCLRKAILSDHPKLCQMILAMAKDSEGIDLNIETLSNGVKAVLEDASKGQYWFWVNRANPQDIWASCLITSEWSDWHNRIYYWLQSVYIPPNQRGNGILRDFLESLTQALKTQQGHEIRLYVDENNQRAIQAYLKIGFEVSHYKMMVQSI